MNKHYEYDVTLSYAEEDRKYAEVLAKILGLFDKAQVVHHPFPKPARLGGLLRLASGVPSAVSRRTPHALGANLATEGGSPGILMREECMGLAAREEERIH